MVALQRHIAQIDPLKRQRSVSDFDATAYIDHLLQRIESANGVLLVALEAEVPVGFVAGIIPVETESDLLEHYPTKEGTIVELVVTEEQRGKNIGSDLLKAVEEYFKQEGCDSIRVGCFSPNTGAHMFYEKCGYSDRYIEMLKSLE